MNKINKIYSNNIKLFKQNLILWDTRLLIRLPHYPTLLYQNYTHIGKKFSPLKRKPKKHRCEFLREFWFWSFENLLESYSSLLLSIGIICYEQRRYMDSYSYSWLGLCVSILNRLSKYTRNFTNIIFIIYI